MNRFVFVCLILAIFTATKSNGLSLDSLRLEKKDGQNFVIHKVTKGQTLFGTLRKYGTSLAEYKNANPEIDLEIKIGQILRIPYFKPIKENVSKKGVAKTFTVEPGMTLFSVAKRNAISVSELKRLNNLTSDAIQSGQILIVREGELNKNQKQIDKQINKEVANLPKSTVENPDFKEDINKVATKKYPENEIILAENKKESSETIRQQTRKSDSTKKVAEPIKNDQVATKFDPSKETIKSFDSLEVDTQRVLKIEEGIAEIIQVESKSGKYLALHKSAPLGTLVQVKNETNGATVWVKVIGRLPELDQNQNVIIKLSPRAMDRISPVERRFRAKINYSL